MSFIGGARAPTGSQIDAETLASKTAVGLAFADREGLGDVSWAQAVMDNIDGTPAGFAAAKQLVDAYAAQAATAGSSQFILEFVGVSLEEIPGLNAP